MPFAKLCFSGQHDYESVKKKLNRQGGMLSYLGTDDMKQIEDLIAGGDTKARNAYDAMVYQIAKEVGAYAVVLKGDIDAIIITGGIAHSNTFVDKLKEWIVFLCPRVLLYPGEGEMEVLARGVLRVLRKEEDAKTY